MLTAVGVKLEESFQSQGCVCWGGGRALVCRVVQQQGEVKQQCDAGLRWVLRNTGWSITGQSFSWLCVDRRTAPG